MRKSSKKKSNRISAIILLPIIAVIIAVPVILTILVEAPVSGTKSPAGTSVTTDISVSGGSDDPDSGGVSADSGSLNPNGMSADSVNPNPNNISVGSDESGSGSISAEPNAPDTLHSDSSESLDFPSSSTEAPADIGTDSAELHSSPPSGDADIPAPPCTLDDIPAYSGGLYTTINDNVPFFTNADSTPESFERYSVLDSLGRCGAAYANIGRDLMPTEERGAIGHIRPSGWHTVKYEGIDGNYLYNRCHLIAFQLAGENANERNLITGTRMFNAVGMLPFEETVGDYVRETGNHVLYRVTPMFRGGNLVADGVLMEAWSVEDSGAGVCFNVFVYNVQPGIVIDYATGESYADGGSYAYGSSDSAGGNPANGGSDSAGQDNSPGSSNAADGSIANPGNNTDNESEPSTPTVTPDADYVLNTNTGKFHYPYCDSVLDMSERNKFFYSGSREDVIAMGYVPCKRCNP